MAKSPRPKSPRAQRAAAAPAQRGKPSAANPQLNRQTRKMLGKHYRAKFGVK